jgi:hypothetical protein
MDGMDYRLLDDEFWQNLESSEGYIFEHPENHDLKTDRWARRTQLRSDVTKYLADKLAKEMNVTSMQVPWSKMTEDDIINWPSDVKVRPLYQMETCEVRKLHKLVKEDQLDFTPEFLDSFANHAKQLRSDIKNYIADKLAKKLNVPSMQVPWSKMTGDDIINWPSDVKVRPLYQMETYEVRKLHNLVKEDQLDFTPEFLGRFKSGRVTKWTSDRWQLRASRLAKAERKSNITKDIETALLNKLNAGTNKKFKLVPWTILREENIMNWPKGLPIGRLSRYTNKRLELLHKLREQIFFSEEFLQRLSDPSFDRTPIGLQIIQPKKV